jgi:hypothetical protein
MLNLLSWILANKLRDSDHSRRLPSRLGYLIILIAILIFGLICFIYWRNGQSSYHPR